MAQMAERVRNRLDALGLNPFEVARRMDVERGFVNDLLIGRKKSVRGDSLYTLASILECDAEFLLGQQDVPRRARRSVDASTAVTVPVAGIVEAGVWREAGAGVRLPASLPLQPDPRFPVSGQAAWIVRGPGADLLGILDGDAVVTVPVETFAEVAHSLRHGDAVVARRERDGETMTMIVGLDQGRNGLVAVRRSSEFSGEATPIEAAGAIVGVVVRAVRVFG